MSAAALLAAIDAGDDAGVTAALAADPAAAAARDADGVSSTLHALYRGQAAIAERIAAALTELDVFEAAALGRIERLRELLAANPALATARSADGFTALHYPAFFGRGEAAAAAAALLDAGADVNARSDNAFSVLPIHSAVAGGHDAVVAVLVDAGADVNARQRHGWTPLHGAAQNGRLPRSRSCSPRARTARHATMTASTRSRSPARPATTGSSPASADRPGPPESGPPDGCDERFRDGRRHTLSSTTARVAPQSRRPWTSENSSNGHGTAIMTPSRSCSTCVSRGWTRQPG